MTISDFHVETSRRDPLSTWKPPKMIRFLSRESQFSDWKLARYVKEIEFKSVFLGFTAWLTWVGI
jgi:hypothetical protein